MIVRSDINLPEFSPIVVRVDTFSKTAARQFMLEFNRAACQGIIPIEINSYGGEVDGLLSMYSMIIESEVPVLTYVSGNASSAAAILLALGHEGLRFASPHSRIMLHNISSGLYGTSEDIDNYAKVLSKQNKQICSIIEKRCKMEKGFISNKLKNNVDWHLSPNEALKVGLIDHVKIPTLNIKINTFISY